MVVLSFQNLRLRELLPATDAAVGRVRQLHQGPHGPGLLDRSSGARSLFTVVSVPLTVVLGLGVALLMRRVAPSVRIAMIVAMMFVWAMPQLVAAQIFRWMVDADFGVVNYLIDQLPGVDFAEPQLVRRPDPGLDR